MDTSPRRTSSRVKKPTRKMMEIESYSNSLQRTQLINGQTKNGRIGHVQQNPVILISPDCRVIQKKEPKAHASKRCKAKVESEQMSGNETENEKFRIGICESNTQDSIEHEENSDVQIKPKIVSSVLKKDDCDLNSKKCNSEKYAVQILLKNLTTNQKKTPDRKEETETEQQKETDGSDGLDNSVKNSRETDLLHEISVMKLQENSNQNGYVFGNVIKKNGTAFKEDGSLVEEQEAVALAGFKAKAGRECMESFKNKGDSVRNELNEECGGDDDEDLSSETEAQIKIEFDEFAETAELEEVDFDFEEGNVTKSLECPVCLKVLSNKCNLNKHLSLHRAEKPFQCEICGVAFAVQNYLKMHSLVHSGNRKHKCNTCGKSFLRRSNLNSHRLTHTDVKAFSCQTCGKKFKTKAGRDSHERDHESIQTYQCEQCGKSFQQQSYLQKHIGVHKGEKPFRCTVCGKSFPYNQSLQEHMRRHTGEKPEVCSKCGKRFNNKRQLKAHMKYHNTVSAFECKECNVFYDTQQSLNKHLTKTHNRKHECEFCNQSFLNKKHLMAHRSAEHKELVASINRIPQMQLAKAKKVECTMCNRVFFNRYVLSKHLMSKHQLSEKEMKELLQIRKKAVSKKQVGSYMVDEVNDFSKLLENDSSFRVYYKDDEMAVYVKGTDNLDTRTRRIINSNEDIPQIPEQDVKYFVYEDLDNVAANDVTRYPETIPVSVSNDAAQLAEGGIQNIQAVSKNDDVSITDVADEVIETEEENPGQEGQNYYVVFTDTNEKSDSTVHVLGDNFVSETDMHGMNSNEPERIVLILNENEGDKNIMLENGAQYEIVTDGEGILQGDTVKRGSFEVEEVGQVMDPAESYDGERENTAEVSKDNDVAMDSDLHGTACNLPLLEQLQATDTAHDMQLLKSKSDKMKHRNKLKEIKESSEVIQQFASIKGTIGKSIEIEIPYQATPPQVLSPSGENFIVIPAMGCRETDSNTSSNNLQLPSYPEVVNTDSQISESSLEELVPRNNTDQEFTNFENALKSKVGEFKSQDDYNDFLDKMIQTLQKAKHRDPAK